MRRKPVLLFDLGGTLVEYFRRLYIGDDRWWDWYGARRAGIAALLIDRVGTSVHRCAADRPRRNRRTRRPGSVSQAVLRSLADLEPILQRSAGGRGAGGVLAGAASAERA